MNRWPKKIIIRQAGTAPSLQSEFLPAETVQAATMFLLYRHNKWQAAEDLMWMTNMVFKPSTCFWGKKKKTFLEKRRPTWSSNRYFRTQNPGRSEWQWWWADKRLPSNDELMSLYWCCVFCLYWIFLAKSCQPHQQCKNKTLPNRCTCLPNPFLGGDISKLTVRNFCSIKKNRIPGTHADMRARNTKNNG